MLSRNTARVVFAGLLLVAFSVPSPSAFTSGNNNASSDVSGSAEGTGDGGGQVTISVESSVTAAGSGGGDGSGGGVTSSSSGTEVTVAPVCYYKPGDTGAEAAQGIGKVKEYLDEHEKKASARDNKRVQERHDKVKQQIDKNYPDYESHKDDTQGRWYGRYCDASRLDPKNNPTFKEDLASERKAFEEANPERNIWVPAGQQAPRPYISGTRLAKMAWDAVKIPAPTVETNPKVGTQGATLVGYVYGA